MGGRGTQQVDAIFHPDDPVPTLWRGEGICVGLAAICWQMSRVGIQVGTRVATYSTYLAYKDTVWIVQDE